MGREILGAVSETAALDTDLLVEHVTGLDRVGLLARPEARISEEELLQFQELLRRRLTGEPVAYLVRSKEFRSIDLIVAPCVLVPRPETELLVELGLKVLEQRAGRRRLLDMGTGSGAVALAMASEIPADRRGEIEIVASDISHEALMIAEANRSALGLDHAVNLVLSDLFAFIEGSFDLILTNLPYLRSDQRHPSTSGEPALALYAGVHGLDLYRRFLPEAGRKLRPGGVVACEIDPSQSRVMLELAADSIPGAAEVLKDLAGRDRIVVAGDVDIVRTVVDTWPYGA